MFELHIQSVGRKPTFTRWIVQLSVALALVFLPQVVSAQVVAYDMVGSTSQNLMSFTNP